MKLKKPGKQHGKPFVFLQILQMQNPLSLLEKKMLCEIYLTKSSLMLPSVSFSLWKISMPQKSGLHVLYEEKSSSMYKHEWSSRAGGGSIIAQPEDWKQLVIVNSCTERKMLLWFCCSWQQFIYHVDKTKYYPGGSYKSRSIFGRHIYVSFTRNYSLKVPFCPPLNWPASFYGSFFKVFYQILQLKNPSQALRNVRLRNLML